MQIDQKLLNFETENYKETENYGVFVEFRRLRKIFVGMR